MRYAIFTSSENGLNVAGRIKKNIKDSVDIYVHEGLGEQSEAISYSRLSDAVKEEFSRYGALIFIMAAGIVVRTIAPFLNSKLTDPAVVVMDEQAKNIISLLSGHMGGANELTLELAEILHSNPVITTATDVNNKLAPDLLASRLGLVPYPKKNILHLNNAVLGEVQPEYLIDENIPCLDEYLEKMKENGIEVTVCNDGEITKRAVESGKYKVIVSAEQYPVNEWVLYLRPRRLIAGVGCRRGVGADLIRGALEESCKRIGWSIDRIDELASTTFKADEKGLLDIAKELNKKITFWDNSKLKEQIEYYNLAESEFVRKAIGVGNVAEAAAFCCVNHGVEALLKTKYEKVTVALIWEK
ncbi:Cobalamin biosynthesis protein CbiG [Anaerovibrio sp. JC8]|uniref:cobalt-precorrin 5A hydrolase n=1 Tax=Anaerovibrio sp. JC8 TaxID=1240085 RepID=UPI000A0B58A6|nr:cobalt-precorrin 5A hydrolase [Anaerovibrio sp. JC8]ORT99544.1 Cobalamin biosynthesis protein CbiG [Anaerovibrio sp. JC8]